MSSDTKGFIAFVVGAVIVISAIVLGTTIYNLNATDKMAEMVANGANPLDAACAIDNTYNACLVAAKK